MWNWLMIRKKGPAMNVNEALKQQFREELLDKANQAKEYKYNPTRFIRAVKGENCVAAVQKWIKEEREKGKFPEGFIKLACEIKRPNLTAEDSVCKPEYADLFDAKDIAFCKELLKKINRTIA